MSYEIALATLGIGISDLLNEVPEYHWLDISKDIQSGGVARITYNMENLWAWNIPDLVDSPADGPCVFVRWLQ